MSFKFLKLNVVKLQAGVETLQLTREHVVNNFSAYI